tara:strand:+ start:240 stop:1013 length:774 start_codon:yes stop_codon:yes gene_type:complete
MSWNGTVRCSYCGEKGHNRRGCPSLKERLEEVLATPEDARNYDERCLVSEFERKKYDAKLRACSYCGERGHNRRTCEVLAKHRDYVQKQQVAFRTAFLKHVREIGLNIGAIVTHDKENARHPAFVTDIRWDNIDITSAHQSINCFVSARPLVAITNQRAGSWFTVRAPNHWPTGRKWTGHDHRWQEQTYGLKIVSSVDKAVEPPSGWLTSEEEVKDFFRDREAWMWPSEGDSVNDASYYSCEFWNLEEKEKDLAKIA